MLVDEFELVLEEVYGGGYGIGPVGDEVVELVLGEEYGGGYSVPESEDDEELEVERF